MAESTVKALERQLDSLKRLCVSLEKGSFPKVLLVFGEKTPEEVQAAIDGALAEYGLDIEGIESLGIVDQISVCRLPWLNHRNVAAKTLPDVGSE